MDDETTGAQQKIGQLAALVMDFAEQQELDELVLGGVVLAGKTNLGTNVVLTRTTARDPFACVKLWSAAIDLEIDTARQDVTNTVAGQLARIRQLEEALDLEPGEDP